MVWGVAAATDFWVTRIRGFHNAIIVVLVSCLLQTWGAERVAAGQKFQADEWVTECDSSPGIGPPDCSITVPFWESQGSPTGSFALVVMLQTGNIGIVGQPFPDRAVLRVDKNPPIECRQVRYCVFPSIQALAVLKQLKIGSLVLIDVHTQKGEFSFSLTPKGFQAGMAQMQAWGYRTE
jgi:invasion protein IalB